MIAQGILPFRYECEPTASGMTALAGLPPYLELAVVSGLTDSVRRHLRVCSEHDQGWTDTQIVMSLVLLNVAGGNSVDDLKILERDEGFARVLRRVELHRLRRKERREQERRWRSVMQDLVYLACRLVKHARRWMLSFGKNCPWLKTWQRVYLRSAPT